MNQIVVFLNQINSGTMVFSHHPNVDNFFNKVVEFFGTERFEKLDEKKMQLFLHNNVLFFGYRVTIKIHEKKLKYSFENSGIFKILFTAVLAGAFMFRGNVGSYFFWAFVVFAIAVAVNSALTKKYIKKLLKKCIKNVENQLEPSIISQNTSLTYQRVCPACGCFYDGFSQCCKECGLNLDAGKIYNFGSVTNYKNWEFKYFDK